MALAGSGIRIVIEGQNTILIVGSSWRVSSPRLGMAMVDGEIGV
jgi:hypothetical protein